MSPTSDALTRPLNASFNSAYRLTLRALSAGVRHHPTATRNLRRLYRPAFREARKLLHEYTGNPSDEAGARLRDWNERLDRTLSLLYSSATSAGGPSHLIKNLAYLTDAYHTRLHYDTVANQKHAGQWDGQIPPQNSAKLSKKRIPDPIHLSAWSALGELVAASEKDLHIVAGYQEQQETPIKRSAIPRPSCGAPRKTQRIYYRFIGRGQLRPKDLK